MKQTIIIIVSLFMSIAAFSQSRFSKTEFSINGFRNPSTGLEYRRNHLSYHAGYYPAAMKPGVNSNFAKAGITYWFAPVGKKENPSSFYAGVNYLRGYSREYKAENGMGAEAGFRWMIGGHFNLRIGGIVAAFDGHPLKLNPAGGLSYSFFFN